MPQTLTKNRNKVALNYNINGRLVTVTAYDTVGVDDVYTMLLQGVLHRYATGEKAIEPVSRSVKDWIIKINLNG